jgi:hypothetical protein
MRRLALAFAALVCLVFPAAAQQVGGEYTVEGKNFDGSPYHGTATITFQNDLSCTIEWVSGPNTSSGICMKNGNMFAAAYEQQGVFGILSYQILDSGVLDGAWTVAGQDGYGVERLTPQ